MTNNYFINAAPEEVKQKQEDPKPYAQGTEDDKSDYDYDW